MFGVDAQAAELIVIDSDHDDLVFVPEIRRHGARIGSLELDICDGAAHLGIHRRMKANFGDLHQLLCPVVLQVAKASFFGCGPDRVVERDRFTGREIGRFGMRSNRFELTNIVIHALGCRHEWPESLDFVPLYIEQARSLRGQEPFVKARPEIVASDIFLFELELSEGVGSIDHDLDVVLARESTNLLHRKDLPREIDLV